MVRKGETPTKEAILLCLLERDMRFSELVKCTNKNKSTVSRALRSLMKEGFVKKVFEDKTPIYMLTNKGFSEVLNIAVEEGPAYTLPLAIKRFLERLGASCQWESISGVSFLKCEMKGTEFLLKVIPGIKLSGISITKIKEIVNKVRRHYGDITDYVMASPLGRRLYSEKVSLLNVIEIARDSNAKVLLIIIGEDPRNLNDEIVGLLDKAFDSSAKRIISLLNTAERTGNVLVKFAESNIYDALTDGLREILKR